VRIGIDGRALTGRYTGDRTYWSSLLRDHLTAPFDGDDDEYVVYSRLPIPEGCLPLSDRVTFRTVSAANDRVWTLVTFPHALREDGIDVAHTQYTIPLRAPCRIITTVHDISFRLYPEWFPRKDRLLLNLTVPAAMRRAAKVVTDSMSSRRDILRVYHFDPDHVDAIPLAASPDFQPVPSDLAREHVMRRFGLEGPYIISVGVLQPRKNFPLLVEAFARAVYSVGLPHRLVISGKRGWGYDEIAIQIARLRLADRVLVTDYVEDADLPPLYSAAEMMAFPSLYEGFGLPPLEAMACGAATLVSDAPAMPEVVGNGALVLPVMDAAKWAEGLIEVATVPDKRRHLRNAGRARAREYDWATTGRRTRQLYRQVAANPDLRPA